MNSLGVRLFTIRYDGKAVQSETAPAMPGPFMPERLLADMQLVFWPLREPRGSRCARRDGS